MIQVAKNKDFAFDAVFGPNATQREVYEQTAGDTIRNNLFKGFNVTVLACKCPHCTVLYCTEQMYCTFVLCFNHVLLHISFCNCACADTLLCSFKY